MSKGTAVRLLAAAAVLAIAVYYLTGIGRGLFRFESPWALLFLLLLPFLFEQTEREAVFAKLRLRRKKPAALLFAAPCSFSALEAEARRSSWRSRWASALLSALKAGAFVMLVVALARPQLGTAFREIEGSGRDIMMALDLSGSMQVLDFVLEGKRVDRLTALKSVVKDFIDAREGDRLGLVVFGAEVFTQSPLTTDRQALKQFVDALEIGMAGESTSLGDALGLSLKRIAAIEGKSKALILVTDGKNTSGTLEPEAGADLARQLGVKVYVVGIGGPEAAPFPVRDIFGRVRYVMKAMEYDEPTLQKIADVSGGRYFNAKNTEALGHIYREIDKLEERLAKTYEHVDYEERYLPFALVGLALLLGAECLASTILLKAG